MILIACGRPSPKTEPTTSAPFARTSENRTGKGKKGQQEEPLCLKAKPGTWASSQIAIAGGAIRGDKHIFAYNSVCDLCLALLYAQAGAWVITAAGLYAEIYGVSATGAEHFKTLITVNEDIAACDSIGLPAQT